MEKKFDIRDYIYEFEDVQFQFHWGAVNSKATLIDLEYSYHGNVNGFYNHLNEYFDEEFIKGIFDESIFVVFENDSNGSMCQRTFQNECEFFENLSCMWTLCIIYTQYE